MSKGSTTSHEEKLPPTRNQRRLNIASHYEILKTNVGNTNQGESGDFIDVAWGLVIVIVVHGRENKSFQNYGLLAHI